MRKALLLAATLLVVALAGAAYVLFAHRRAAEETAELVEQGGEKWLRPEPRSARPGPRLLLLAMDGVGDSLLRHALASGRMPRLAALLGEPIDSTGLFRHGYAAPEVLSILPSTTMAAWSSVYTGEPPARHGVPGNEWLARHEGRFYAPAPVSVSGHLHTLRMYTDGLMGQVLRVPTLFERADVRSYVSLAPVHRGADLFTIPDAEAVAKLFGAFAEGVTGADPVKREVYSAIDSTSVAQVIDVIGRHGPADLQVVYFPGVDLFTHAIADPLAQQLGYLAEVIDPAIGRVLDAYRRADALDSTYVLLVADHGHTPVAQDDRHALEAEGDDEPTAVLARAGFRLRRPVLDVDEREEDYQAAVAYQGAFAYVYLADRSRCAAPGQRCDWTRPPRLAEDVLPVVRAFDAANRTGAGVPSLRGALDLILVRVPIDSSDEGGTAHVWDGGRLVPLRAHLARRPRPELLRFEERVRGLVDGPYGDHAGDVLLLARTGADRPIAERFYFSGRYHSWHGGPQALDSRIPLLVARAGDDGRRLRERVRARLSPAPSQLDVAPLVLDLLEAPRPIVHAR